MDYTIVQKEIRNVRMLKQKNALKETHIPSASPKEEWSSNKQLKSIACFKHSSTISNCNTQIREECQYV